MKRIENFRDLKIEKDRMNQKVEMNVLKLEKGLIQLKYQSFDSVLKTVYGFLKSKKSE